MTLAKIRRSMILFVALFLTTGLTVSGCMVLNDTINDLQNEYGSSMIGTTPTSSFADDGAIAFSVLPDRTEDGEKQDTEMLVEVLNSDGTYSECKHEASKVVEGNPYNSLGLLMDNSGSMENAYPVAEYGDLCPTCPHDPERKRITASAELLRTLSASTGEQHIALVEFNAGFEEGPASFMVHEFSSNYDSLIKSLESMGGTDKIGTPLWDTLGELIPLTGEEAEEFETALQVELGRDPVEEPVDGEEPVEEIEVERFLLVISDGDDRDSISQDLGTVVALAQEHNVTIHAIGLGPAAAAFNDAALQVDEQVSTVQNLQKLADSTGGFYASVNDPEALSELFRVIAESLTSGYELEEWVCQPDGALPKSGQKMEGRVTVNGETTEWSMIAP